MNITKTKGDIGLTSIIAECTKQNINVSLPIAEHLSYDLLLEYEGTLCSGQARYSSLKNGIIKVKLSSSWSNKKGNHVKSRKREDFGILCVYCPQTNTCYFLAASEFSAERQMHLCIKQNKNGRSRDANQYLSCQKAIKKWDSEKLDDIVYKNKIDIPVGEIIRLKKQNMSWGEIGTIYGVSGVSVRNILVQKNIDVKNMKKEVSFFRKPEISQKYFDIIDNELKLGKSQRLIAKENKISRYKVDVISNMIKNKSEDGQDGNAADC